MSTDKRLGLALLVIFLVLPLAAAYASNPVELEAGWNEGKGSLLLVLVFVAIEGLDATYRMNKTKLALALACSIFLSLIFYYDPSSLQFITQAGTYFGVAPSLLIYSWHEFWVTVVYLALVLALIVDLTGLGQFRAFLFTLVYTVLMAIVLLLDAIFPYNELGPLQAFVPVLVGIATYIMKATKLVNVTSFGNIMLINAGGTVKALVVYWPSAGVDSFLIFTGIAIAFLLKQRIGGIKLVVYTFLGALGTISVNIFRIILLAYYTEYYPAQSFQTFHDVIGEILFLPWLVAFMIIVHYVEKRLAEGRKLGLAQTEEVQLRPKPTPSNPKFQLA
ncbi:MAG TPA: exosortase/archaeosortase family protein [Nitrososphaerales archaeon]|nr:exosortase/archaeosortase family protein [Nitrososphaerales archaeon]